MSIIIDIWLYGELARYGGQSNQGSFANLKIALPTGSTVSDLLAVLNLPTKERGITFINGNLSALPDVQPDLNHALANGDRVALFHLRSMWPYQYRQGTAMTNEFAESLASQKDQGFHHT